MTRTSLYITALLLAAGTVRADPGTEFFETKVRPVLAEHCYKCHSTAAKKQQGGLHLDTRDAIRAGGDTGPAIVPGKPAESLLLKAVRQTGDLKMPPKSKLPDAVIADLEKWIAIGAPDPRGVATAARSVSIEEGRKFWSFQPLRRPALPEISNAKAQISNPIDRFIVAKLHEKGITPNPPADRRTLIRRVYFDVIGLPPTPAEVAAFVNDPDPNAYAKLIDKLLASPHYGERWGRHWLDLARFGESSGYEHDNDRPYAYQYRDFVIEALNRDVPFDRFVRWQIAGDQLEPDNPLAVKATGFLAAGTMNGQVTEREAEPARYEVFDDWVGTTGTAFLGLTVGCARCHDHKYDPIPSRDYYNLAANFTRAVRANVTVPRGAGRDLSACDPPPDPWVMLEAQAVKAGGGKGSGHTLTRQPDGSYLFTRVNGEIGPVEFVAEAPLATITAVRIDALTDETLPNYGPGLGDHGNFTLSNFAVPAGPAEGKPTRVKLKLVRSTTGAKGGAWSVDRQHAGRDQSAVYDMAGLAVGPVLRFQLSFPGDSPAGRQSVGRFRLSVCGGEAPNEFQPPRRRPPPPHETAFAVTEGVPPYRMMIQGPDLYAKTFVLKRGDVDKKEGEATPGVLQVLSPGGRPEPAAHPRVALANWLTDVDRGAGALAARVIVNRLWQHHMSRGIVGTPSDFGAQGDRPTHPELLDWLASELVARGWSLKAIHREILLSATYRQSSARNPEAEAVDPDDHLWWRRPLVRLEAEAIRDAMLAVSRRLDRRPFGPGSLDEGMTRRSVYFTVKRSALIPSMVQLDWPEALQGVGQRVTTTVAPQALLMLNSPHVRANAAAFAAELRPLPDPVTAGYERAIGRSPTDAERAAAAAFLAERTKADGPGQALTDFCQALFAMNEFSY
ncbi:MAG TPA: PSD1 and planctomycete cytochrome C domain-containing protein, partial [Gemmataceae bacterium]